MQRLVPSQRRLAIGLAALAGFVDGVGFLTAGGYFVSFMSGNTTRLAVDLATDPASAVLPALLITGFTCGAFAGALVALRSGRWQARNVAALAAALLLAGAAAQYLGSVPLALAGLVLAMGALNNCFQREGSNSFGLTYMTGALVRFGQGLAYRLSGRDAPGFLGLLALWAALGGGAVLGALAQQRFGQGSIALAAGLALIAVAVTILIGPDRRGQD
jgi:uncharacterized membrane protein YoaK (UPF0700 family)